jgi:hypothetical protein
MRMKTRLGSISGVRIRDMAWSTEANYMLMDRPQTLLSAHCSSQFMLEQALLYYVPGVSLKSIEDTNSVSLKSIVHATTKNSRSRTVLSSTAVDIYSFEYRVDRAIIPIF